MALQAVGGWYVDRTIVDASATYGTFALVIGLLSWFWLGSHLLLAAAEVNVVLHRRLWPRSLTGPLTTADRTALARAALAARQHPRQHVAVTFDDGSVDERLEHDHDGADRPDPDRPRGRVREARAAQPGGEEAVDAEQPQA